MSRGLWWMCLAAAWWPSHARAEDDAEDRYPCKEVVWWVQEVLKDTDKRPIALTDPPSVDDEVDECEAFATVRAALSGRARGEVKRGTINGHPAAVLTEGPEGTARFWDVTVAVKIEGKVLGACFRAATAGWRSLASPRVAKLFPRWRPLSGERLLLWTTIGKEGAAGLLLPEVFRLDGHVLRLDPVATAREVADFGRRYARAADVRGNDFREMHRTAAAGYLAFVDGGRCPAEP